MAGFYSQLGGTTVERTDTKMVIAIVQDQHRRELNSLLVERGFRATFLNSTGSFLQAGNTTIMVGVEESRIEELLSIIEEVTKRKNKPPSEGSFLPTNITISAATVFVIDVEQFIRFE